MLKNVLLTLVFVIILIVAWQLVPIYYKAFSLDGICQQNADLVHRYSEGHIKQQLNEDLDKLGIPEKQRETAITRTKENIVVEIYYEDKADFFGYYKKDFVFVEECYGVLTSIISN